MEYEKLKSAAEAITMPEEMKQRIVRNCKTQISDSGKESIMKHNNCLRKPAAVLITLALCIGLSVTAVAAPDILRGYFRDLTNWQGAVVGTSYEQATDEIGVNVTVNGKELTVLATFSVPQEFPYREVEKLGIAAFQIVDAKDRIIKEGTADTVEVINGQAAIKIQLNDMESGCYKLIVTTFVDEKKADQPMNINGRWECAFIK